MFTEQATYNTLGTFAAPVTLTNEYGANTGSALFSRYFGKLHLGGKYTPGANNSYFAVLVEVSNDPIYGDLPTNWEPMTVQVGATTEIDVYADGGALTTAGIPIIVPGDKTSTSGTAISWNWDGDINANWVRVSVKENVGSNNGTVNVEVTLKN